MDDRWQPIETAPKDGTEVLAWFPKIKLDDDDNPTGEVVGGAMAPVQWQGEGWMEPGWLEASGSYFFDDFCFADEPVLWHPLPPEPAWPSDAPTAATPASTTGSAQLRTDEETVRAAIEAAQLTPNRDMDAYEALARLVTAASGGSAVVPPGEHDVYPLPVDADAVPAATASGAKGVGGDGATPCAKCGQTDHGQTGEYACPECGLPMVWDVPVTGAASGAKGGSDGR